MTTLRRPVRSTASVGTVTASRTSTGSKTTVANIPLRSRPSGFGTAILTVSVRVCSDSSGSMNSTVPRIVSPGKYVKVTSASAPGRIQTTWSSNTSTESHSDVMSAMW